MVDGNIKLWLVLGCLTFLCLSPGCDDDETSEEEVEVVIGLESIEEGSCLQFEVLDGEAAQPSNVTLFFSMKTCADQTPVLGVAAENFTVTEGGVPVSPYESHLSILPKCIGYDLLTILLLDLSGSIFETESLPSVVEAAKEFASNLTAEEHYISIHLFDGRAETEKLVDFTKDTEILTQALDSVLNRTPVDSSTNLNGAVIDALDILNEREFDSDALVFQGSVVAFTDGTDQANIVDNQTAADLVGESFHKVYTIGLGEEVEENHLKAIGPAGTFLASTLTELTAAFQESSEQVLRSSQNYYVIGYCSPKRSGKHMIELTVDGFKGTMRAEFDASDFTTGCNAETIVEQAKLEAKACSVTAPWEVTE